MLGLAGVGLREVRVAAQLVMGDILVAAAEQIIFIVVLVQQLEYIPALLDGLIRLLLIPLLDEQGVKTKVTGGHALVHRNAENDTEGSLLKGGTVLLRRLREGDIRRRNGGIHRLMVEHSIVF